MAHAPGCEVYWNTVAILWRWLYKTAISYGYLQAKTAQKFD